MCARRDELRVAALLLAGLLAVHQLRYSLAFGGDARQALAEHGHGYLAWVTPLAGALAALALGRLLVRAASGVAADRTQATRLMRLWPTAALALLGLYVGQELIEGWLADAHPSWWAGMAGNGGWLAIPLAAIFGGIVACLLRLSEAAESRIRRGCCHLRPVPVAALAPPGSSVAQSHAFRAGVLARHLAGRAPPLRSV